jgi:PHD/YefM family antitoxin component YafN of YafNO toxin-antitoxin module
LREILHQVKAGRRGFFEIGREVVYDISRILRSKARAPKLRKSYVIAYASAGDNFLMSTMTASQARKELYRLLDQAAETHEAIHITGKRSHGVLVAEDDWQAIQETLYLLQVPGMRESIRRGMLTPISKCSEKPGW